MFESELNIIIKIKQGMAAMPVIPARGRHIADSWSA